MRTFIRVVESWVPGADRSTLEYGGGLHSQAPRFGAASRSVRFRFGEGLPGQAWARKCPIVLTRFEDSYFQRTDIAHAEGLTCGIAVPIFAGDFLLSVLVLFCGDDDAHAGAIELWHNDPADGPDMKLKDGYYGTTAEAFEYISRRTSFRRGNGLPGLAWSRGTPLFIEDLGMSGRFLRASTATKVGINRGFAIPCPVPTNDTYVMSFLSALGTPIVQRFESWEPGDKREHLNRAGGYCEKAGILASSDDARLGRGEGAIGTAFLSGAPAFSENLAAEPGIAGPSAAAAGLGALVAVPIVEDSRVVAVVAWYF